MTVIGGAAKFSTSLVLVVFPPLSIPVEVGVMLGGEEEAVVAVCGAGRGGAGGSIAKCEGTETRRNGPKRAYTAADLTRTAGARTRLRWGVGGGRFKVGVAYQTPLAHERLVQLDPAELVGRVGTLALPLARQSRPRPHVRHPVQPRLQHLCFTAPTGEL